MVKIKLKTLANKTFDMDLDDQLTIADLKVRIQDQFQLGEPDLLKLIYTGKVLKDEMTVTQASIKEGGFIVVMASKKKEPVAAPAQAPAPSPPASAAPVQAPAPLQEPAAAAAAPAPSDSGLVRGPAYEQAVDSLMALGFDRPQVVRALQASFNNPDRAAEYLFSGIPDELGPAPESEAAAAAAVGQGGGGGVPVDLASLQHMFQERPELIDALIQQIGHANPQLLQALGNNRQAFVQLLQNPQAFAQILQAAGIFSGAPMAGGIGAGGDVGDVGVENVIHVTPADRQAIERLESLGFSRDRVLEAYLACDRNEEVAANYLFENGNDAESEE